MLLTLKKTIAALALATVSTAGFTGCVVRETRGYGYANGQQGYAAQGSVAVGNPGTTYVDTMPPDPLYEEIAASPGYGNVWIDGFWNWNGYEWVWIPGHWENTRQGYVYIQPYYDYDATYGRYVYVSGYWERGDRVPNGVVVNDHTGGGRPVTGYRNPTSPTRPVVGGGTRPVVPTRPGDPQQPVQPTRPVIVNPQPEHQQPVQPEEPNHPTVVRPNPNHQQPDNQVQPVRPVVQEPEHVQPRQPEQQPEHVRPVQQPVQQPVVRTPEPARPRDPNPPVVHPREQAPQRVNPAPRAPAPVHVAPRGRR